jgi:hypothetical protein
MTGLGKDTIQSMKYANIIQSMAEMGLPHLAREKP